MPEKLVISENRCNFLVLNYKELQTIIATVTEDKVTELFCMADDFCKFFDAQMRKHENFDVNLPGAIAAYCIFPNKPCIHVQRALDTQLVW